MLVLKEKNVELLSKSEDGTPEMVELRKKWKNRKEQWSAIEYEGLQNENHMKKRESSSQD